ncbi:hypothetical protein SAMN05216203_3121 [Marinobacter daqiaonensis]|uniref:Tetratricopeptide repeat-containing protein n=1 Tax=Marinobacter daqiaonensis TaxID=650891 RepID=A0A1I6JQR4_9GAMM|nr:hypothetical protein [Marinobacter daqiaonensis]SFR80860.1 hypothetical protein SAMN05216203_3121 [Marinobacter daqiaonensis]
MKNDCHYHPGDPAKWHCRECQLHYCSACMPDADARRQHGLCPHCGRTMRYLGAATEVEPFWLRLSRFFRYPFHADPLIVIAVCTFVPLFLQQDILGVVISFVLLLALFKYTYAVIRHTAEGHMKPPPVATAYTGEGFAIVIQQLLVFVAMVALVVASGIFLGPLPAMVVAAFAILALPASIMVLAMEHSVVAAINPLNLATLISRIGWPYFLLYGFLILLTLASGAAQEFAASHLDPAIAQPLAGFLNSTYTLMLFHMLGYLLFQYQEELGFASDFQEDLPTTESSQRDRTRRVDADIDMNLKEGNYNLVAGILEEALKRDTHNPIRLSQLYQLALARNDVQDLARHHVKLLRWMIAHRKHQEVRTLLTVLARHDPDFRIQDPELVVDAADLLFHQQDYRQALRLLKDFHKRFPGSEQIAPAYILVARTLANGFEQWEKAISFLRFAGKSTTDEQRLQAINTYLEQAKRQEPLKGPRASFGPAAETKQAGSF